MKTKAQLFDGRILLTKVNGGKSLSKNNPKKAIFLQGDPADALFYIERGKVKLTVVSKRGKEAVVAILDAGDFLGEGCLAGESRRMANAIPLTECTVVRLEKGSAIRALRDDPEFSELFLAFLDQLFNSSEKRLARILLLLANFGKESKPDKIIAKISQETLAEMVGTTRSRVSFFMNKFRKLGFIEYNGHLEVNSSLLSIVLND
jgi:CRP/FNR family cyclic AMP-dependent transcriptional regulator